MNIEELIAYLGQYPRTLTPVFCLRSGPMEVSPGEDGAVYFPMLPGGRYGPFVVLEPTPADDAD